MAIYLDTNIFPRSGNLEALEFAVLQAAAREAGQDILLTELVVDEVVSSRQRQIEGAFDSVRSVDPGTPRGLPGAAAAPDFPAPGELAREYRREIRKAILRDTGSARGGGRGLRREAYRLTPARGGRGARDTAIWLTLKDHFLTRKNTDGYFLSDNAKDFGSATNGALLHDQLTAELGEDSSSFHYFRSIDAYLDAVASRQNRPFSNSAG